MSRYVGLIRGARHGRLAVLLGASLALAVAGCRHEPLARERMNDRQESMNLVLRRAAKREAENPQRLSRAATFVRKDLQRDEQKLERNLRGAQAYLERDLRRWWERQPVYFREAGRKLRGKPETIEYTSIILFL